MIILKAIAGIISGFAGHQTNVIYEALEENGTPITWIRFSRYGTGYLVAWFVFIAWAWRKRWRDEAALYMLGSGVMVGVGTMIGYFVESRK